MMPELAFVKSTNRQKHMRAIGMLLFAVLITAIPRPVAPNSAEKSRKASEHEVKAAYVYYFARFVEWPAAYVPAQNAPIIIGVVGDAEFSAFVENAVRNKLVQERTLQVRLLKWPTDLSSCSIVYVTSNEQKRFRPIMESLQDKSVLTITEAEGKFQLKGIMNLFIEGGKVQFEVNIADAEKAKLRISSKLLRLARETIGNYSGKEN